MEISCHSEYIKYFCIVVSKEQQTKGYKNGWQLLIATIHIPKAKIAVSFLISK